MADTVEGLVKLLRSRIGSEFDDEAHLSGDEAEQIIAALEALVVERDEARRDLELLADAKRAADEQHAADMAEMDRQRLDEKARADALVRGVNGVVNFQSALTRSQVREAMADLLQSVGRMSWGANDESPFVTRALAAEAKQDKLAEALKPFGAILVYSFEDDPSTIIVSYAGQTIAKLDLDSAEGSAALKLEQDLAVARSTLNEIAP